MIVRPRPGALRLLFALRGSILPKIASQLLVILLVSCSVVALYESGHLHWLHQLSTPAFSLLGLALSIFLGFRNNTCYDRWWEARKRWGDLLIHSRSLGRELCVLLPGDAARQRRILQRVIGFTHALAGQLRGLPLDEALQRWSPPAELAQVRSSPNPASALLRASSRDLADALHAGQLTDLRYQQLAGHLHQLSVAQAACERISSTPTPFAYALLLHRSAWLFCLLLPLGLVGTLEALTPLIVVIIAYAFFGLDALGDELEDPFGLSDNDLPLNAMVRRIEIDLLEMLGDPLPPAAEPVHFVLD